MAADDAILQVYRDLAEWYESHGQPQMRDRFLVLAADAAVSAGQTENGEQLRQRLLQLNPHHLLRPYPSLARALQAPDVQTYLRSLRENYPLETARDLLNTVRNSEAPAETAPPPKSPPPEPKGFPALGPGFGLGDIDESFGVNLEQTAALPMPLPAKPKPAPARPERAAPPAASPPKPAAARPQAAFDIGQTANIPVGPRGRASEMDIDKTAKPSAFPRARPADPQNLGETAAIPAPAAPRPAPAPAPRPAPVPARPPSGSFPASPPLAAPTPRMRPVQPSPAPAARPEDPLTTGGDAADPGGWLSLSLFIVVVVCGVALAAYTLVGPFFRSG
jgi:hypothetical protein